MTSISDFDIFARVARTGNMSQAGREMRLSPAVVSKRISMLEDKLGVRLFQRTTRQLTLTETGEGYFKRVVDILNLVEEAEDFVARRNTTPRGILKVSAPTTFSRLHIMPKLPSFLEAYPEIELDFHLTDNYSDIIREGFDVAIRIGALQDSSLVARKLSPETRVLCASPKYCRDSGEPTTLKDLDRHICLAAGAQEVWQLEGPDGRHQLRPNGSIKSNSAELIREALLSGLGIGLRSIWEVGEELRNGRLKILLPQYRGSSQVAIHALYPSRDFVPAKVSVFIDFLASHFTSKPYWEENLDDLLATQKPAAKKKSAKKTKAKVTSS
jgi:DNA-binding transcriptional LysR family regulator